MNPILHIRTNVLGITQAALAEIAGVTQPTISKWEAGFAPPDFTALSRIRAHCKREGVRWKDDWLFEQV